MAEQAQSFLDLALSICDEADAVSLAFFRAGVTARRKQDNSFVTDADLRVETLARERIGAAFPDHGIVGEEFGADAERTSGVRWFVDPIDATHNFMRGIPVFATLLAVEDGAGMVAAAISAPALGARWHAIRGGGAWRQATFRGRALADEPPRLLTVSAIDRLEDAQILDLIESGSRGAPRDPGLRSHGRPCTGATADSGTSGAMRSSPRVRPKP